MVDDGSTDGSQEVARQYRTTLLSTEARSGPARARNLGARAATGEILLFVDADVCVHTDTVERVRKAFANEAGLDALIGSYDEAPESQDFISQYKNLMHSFVHQTARQEACTFWCGCGAIRRALFLEHGGFDESYRQPAVEDIEMGYRLLGAGRKIILDRELQVKHLKRWTLWELIKTDIFQRGIPWTELILRDRRMPNDLNLQLSQRVSVILVWLLPLLLLAALWLPGHALVLAGLAIGAIFVLNRRFFRFLGEKRGWRFALAAAPLQLLYHFYSGLAFLAGCMLHWGRRAGLPRPRSG